MTSISISSLINSKSPTVSLSKALLPLPIFEQFCDALSRVDHVTHLDLSHNQLGDAGVEILSSAFLLEKPQLRILNLKSNGITDVGVAFLVRALSRHGTLKTLILGSNPISDQGLGEIGRMLTMDSSTGMMMTNNNNNNNASSNPANNNNNFLLGSTSTSNNNNNAESTSFLISGTRRPIDLEEIDLMDTPISLHGTLTFADALVKNESLLRVRLPHVLGHRVLQEIERLMRRNWMRKNRVDETRALRAADNFEDELRNAKVAAQWRSVQPKAKPPPPASGFSLEDWSDAGLAPVLVCLEILDKKSKMVKQEEEKERRKATRRVTQVKSVLPSSTLKLPPIHHQQNKSIESGRRAW
jgi:Ran GTPase-activating protein (RanGAP) involved in mRNA processing and transport